MSWHFLWIIFKMLLFKQGQKNISKLLTLIDSDQNLIWSMITDTCKISLNFSLEFLCLPMKIFRSFCGNWKVLEDYICICINTGQKTCSEMRFPKVNCMLRISRSEPTAHTPSLTHTLPNHTNQRRTNQRLGKKCLWSKHNLILFVLAKKRLFHGKVIIPSTKNISVVT